jgi:hypothetical protein
MEVFFLPEAGDAGSDCPQVMAQTGTRSPNHHPTGRSSSLAAADRKPVLV